LETEKKEDIVRVISAAKKFNLPFFILGGGSNLLVSDKGFKELVIKIKNKELKVKNNKIFVEAGVVLNQLVNTALKNNLSGLEWAAGIPGTVGGAICGNAGAFNKSTGDLVKNVEVLEVANCKIKILNNKDCNFRYRDSIFKHKKNLIVLSATLQFKKRNKKEIKERIKKYLNYRKETQPLNYPSAGSIFKNPKGFSGAAASFAAASFAAARQGEEDKSSSLSFAAARMIEECGLKGKRIGNVKISEKHANFIVNLGQGKAKDVKKLIELAKKRVKNKFGIDLEEEICYLGFKN
jgi:UDP-N-acetylmuramate dehydrogenase